jgi:hypothetical protein
MTMGSERFIGSKGGAGCAVSRRGAAKTVMKLRTVAALCVSGRSIYKHTAGVLAFDRARDARTFQGGMPVIAHPPCRCWSKWLSHQAKPLDREGEMNLGVWCVEQVIANGGCLEQPAHSRLFSHCNLPAPGDLANPFLYTVYLEQAWFGFASRKPTWVLVAGVPPADLAPLPFSLFTARLSARTFHREMYSRTMPALADWLCQAARATWYGMGFRSWGLAPKARSGGIGTAPGSADANPPALWL